MTDRDKPELLSSEIQRQPAPDVIDQRKQQIDPAGRDRVDPNEAAKHSPKQPGDVGASRKS